MNTKFVVVQKNAGFFGMGASVARIDDGVTVAEDVLYLDDLSAVNRHVWAKVGGDEKEIVETYQKLPKKMK